MKTKVKRSFLKYLTVIFTVTLLAILFSKTIFADEVIGTIVKIESNRITVQNNQEIMIITVENLQGLKVGDHIKVAYSPLADIFIAKEIQILPRR
jgi:hypothetical protein